jgi:hypothetical protein
MERVVGGIYRLKSQRIRLMCYFNVLSVIKCSGCNIECFEHSMYNLRVLSERSSLGLQANDWLYY